MTQVRRLLAVLALSLPLAALAQTAPTPPAPEKPKTGVTVTPYGFVLLNALVDTETFQGRGTADYPGQAAYNQASGGAYGMTARQSRFGVRLGVNEENWTGAAITGVIEFDFNAGHLATTSTGWYNGVMRLRLASATATWKTGAGAFSVLAGQDYGLVNPLFGTSLAWVASPIFWQAGNVWRRGPMVRAQYTGNYDALGVTAAIAVIHPADNVAGGTVALGAGNHSRRPDLEGRLAFGYKASPTLNGTLGVAYQYGTRRFGNGDAAEDEKATILGVDLEANVPYALVRGEWYLSDGAEDTYNGIFSPGIINPDVGPAKSMGFWAQAVIKPTDKIWITAGYGMGKADEDDIEAYPHAPTATPATFTRKENTQLAGGVIVNAGKFWKLGVEAMQTTTTYLDDEERDAIQLAFSSQLVF